MSATTKLKEQARRHEQREEWLPAIEKYQKVLDSARGGLAETELALYNRIGDLYLRVGRSEQAVRYYEEAAQEYANASLFNNAIALCNKALRLAPSKPTLLHKLGVFCAAQGFTTDARRWFLEYAESRFRAGQLDEALTALEEFADTTDDPTTRELLASRLETYERTEEAIRQLGIAYGLRRRQGADAATLKGLADRIHALDPSADLETLAAAADAIRSPTGVSGVADRGGRGLGIETTAGAAGFDEPPGESDYDPLPLLTEEPPESPESYGMIEPDAAAGVVEPTEAEPPGYETELPGLEPPEPEPAVEPELPGLPEPEPPEPEPEPPAAEPPLAEAAEPELADLGLPELEPPAPEPDIPEPAEAEPAAEAEPWETEAFRVEPAEAESQAPEPEPSELEAPEVGVPGLEGMEFDLSDLGLDDFGPWPAESAPAEPAEAEPAEAEAPELEPMDFDLSDLGLSDIESPEAELPGVESVEFGLPELQLPDVEPSEPEAPSEPEPVEALESEPEAVAPEPGAGEAGLPDVDDPLAGLPLLGEEEEEQEEEQEVEVAADWGLVADEPASVGGLDVDIDDIATVEPEPASVVEAARNRVADMLAQGDRAGAVAELERLHTELAAAGDVVSASDVVAELLELEPDHQRGLQHRVEYAFRTADQGRLLSAYLGLAASLERTGSAPKARAVYHRVLELDPTNERARAALSEAKPAPPFSPAGAPVPPSEAPARADYVDLGDMMREGVGTRGTRFVVAEEEPTGDEEKDFAEILSRFKAMVSEHVPIDDPAAHYDLGLAYKDMGLIDEAIGEFQIALRGGQEELRVYEELGQCFMMKGQHNIAAKVLARATHLPNREGLDMVGVYYHLGRAYEELDRQSEARESYERVIALDVGFRDAAKRLEQL